MGTERRKFLAAQYHRHLLIINFQYDFVGTAGPKSQKNVQAGEKRID